MSRGLEDLDGRNYVIGIAESLARVIAIQITSGWWSYLPQTQRLVLIEPAAIRIARLAFICAMLVPRGMAEWLARVDHVR